LRAAYGIAELSAPALLRSIFGSCRVTVINAGIGQAWLGRGRPVIGAVWHQTMLFCPWAYRRRPYAILISRSRDGEIAARLSRGVGWIPVRGSSSHGGREALHEMIRLLKQGTTAGWVLDGPHGPARVAKMGAIIAARESGVPILPIAAHMPDAWHLRSWDRTAIPRPGSRVWIMYRDPIRVPGDADPDACERLRARIQDELTDMEGHLRAVSL
jgi:hypothetical protein